MTFSYTPADSPPVWLRFTPREEDNLAIEGIVHSGTNAQTITVDGEEKRADEEVSTVAENFSENTAGPHIPSVDGQSQLCDTRLAECEYHQDCIPVGKEQAMQMPVDAIILTTTTGRGRDAAVVEMRLSADQSGSPVDCSALILYANNLPKEFCVVASLPDGKNCWNSRLRCLKIDWLYCPSQVADSDELVPPSMTKTGPRRSDRVMSSQRSSNLHDDSNKTAASLDSRLRGNDVMERENDELGYCRNTAF